MHDWLRLNVVKRARRLLLRIYEVTATYPAEERFVLTSQTRRSAHSIGANLAEGAGRRTRGEFRNSVSNSSGSAYELEWHVLVSHDLNYITTEVRNELLHEIRIIKRMLHNLGNSLT